jgi:hypothetical protein
VARAGQVIAAAAGSGGQKKKRAEPAHGAILIEWKNRIVSGIELIGYG